MIACAEGGTREAPAAVRLEADRAASLRRVIDEMSDEDLFD
jgi:hypothetical protein